MDIVKKLKYEGYENIAYIDEVGRGCLFGDVVACAVIIDESMPIEGVKDSKKLSIKKREKLYEQIYNDAKAIGLSRVDSKVIDKINIKQATRLAMKMAVEGLKDREGNRIVPDYLLIDAETIDMPIPQQGIIGGDDLIYGISAASIIAKVYRDKLCDDWENDYPGYNIMKNKGYGTKEHRDGLITIGPSPLHRRTFIKKILEGKK